MPTVVNAAQEAPKQDWQYGLLLHRPGLAIGRWMKRLRTAMAATQDDFARAFHVSEREVRYWESGEKQPPYTVIKQLEVLEYRLITAGKLPVTDSSLALMYQKGAIGRSTLEILRDGIDQLLKQEG